MQFKNDYKIIGLMSGTSGDGLDIAYCSFEKKTSWSYDIIHAETVPFPANLEYDLKSCHLYGGFKLSILDVEFGKWIGNMVKEFCTKLEIYPDAVSSHGHTVFHQPSRSLSLQIGNGWAIHQACGFPVINDFRMLDIQLGGQGAPLVPIGDQLLFSDFEYCLNLGGIANISMSIGGKRKAFDVCPFNLLLNYFAEKVGKKYDADGEMAKKGKLLPSLFYRLNEIPFYQIKGAKSLGREDMKVYLETIEEEKNVLVDDILHTLLNHFIYQLKKVLILSPKKSRILVTGGGSFNKFFMEELSSHLGEEIIIPQIEPKLSNFKEAMVFGFLGVLKMRDEPNCLASATGATMDNCGGAVFGM